MLEIQPIVILLIFALEIKTIDNMKKNRKETAQEIFIKAFKSSNRDIAFMRNGGGQFVSINKVHKSKKAYDRKRDKKVNIDY